MVTRWLARWGLRPATPNQTSMTERLHKAWVEAALVALFLIYLSVMAVVLEYPGSWVHVQLPWPALRRTIMGVCAGLSLAGIIYSPWGQRTGAHINPAVTLAMALIRRIGLRTTAMYMAAQTVGAVVGMAVAELLLGGYLSHPQVDHIMTAPGDSGWSSAFASELGFSFALMTLILALSSRPRWAPYTGVAVALTMTVFIAVAAPVSGMSLNPVRTLGPALFKGENDHIWLYLVAPPLGMGLAAASFIRLRRRGAVRHLPDG